MQKLEERNTYIPTDIPHVRSNCGLALNVEETLSVPGLKTSSNNSDAAVLRTENILSADAALTGLGSSRTELFSICCKNFPLLIKEHDSRFVIRHYGTVRRGTLIHTLKSVVSATPASTADYEAACTLLLTPSISVLAARQRPSVSKWHRLYLFFCCSSCRLLVEWARIAKEWVNRLYFLELKWHLQYPACRSC